MIDHNTRVVSFVNYPQPLRLSIVGLQVTDHLITSKEEQFQRIDKHLKMAEQIKGNVDLVLFPEQSTIGFPRLVPSIEKKYNLHDFAEKVDGPVCQLFKDAAKKFGFWIGFGMPRIKGHQLYDSYLLASPQGEVITADKKDTFTPFVPGYGYTRLNINRVPMSLVICADVWQDQLTSKINADQPELVIVPTYSRTANKLDYFLKHWKTNILSVNYADEDLGGSSFNLYKPHGQHEILSLGTEEGLISIVI